MVTRDHRFIKMRWQIVKTVFVKLFYNYKKSEVDMVVRFQLLYVHEQLTAVRNNVWY